MNEQNKAKNKKSKKWYENLREIVKKQIEVSNSFKEFEENLKSNYKIKVTEKNITITDNEKLSARLTTLNKIYTNEYIFSLFSEKEKNKKNEYISEEKLRIKRKKLRYRNYLSKKVKQQEFRGVDHVTLKF